ncbi:UDP-GalNAc:beta-1,3-N-acetylgalactosaminyltransferase 1-like [Anneissia japonica]|uniref:UDP-GalNAc:beta-1, 3-N-acetylgalactosaminyltransferase 1-like n=1 Tax=Anneissia japonica TaxID=1529436 RepID=UPI0014258B1C|nr:UDP-GalNAc:beta-1,3-N-acetylgalactosaminyltransferase 1-like [Anneissia japonica]
MNGVVSNADEVERVNESEMLLHPRTKKPTPVLWMVVVLVFIIVYYFSTTNSNSKTSNVNPKLLVNGADVDRQFQQEIPEQNKQIVDVGEIGRNRFERPVAGVPNVQNLNPQPVQNAPQDLSGVQPDGKMNVVGNLQKPAVRPVGGFANPAPLHREPVDFRPGIREGILNVGHGLNLRKDDVNPDYIDAVLNNENPDHDAVIPKFNPNKHVENKKFEDYANVQRPDPKSLPVDIILSPTVTSCEKPVVVVLITTVVKDARLRTGIRRTWGKKANVDQPDRIEGDWKVFFVMGRPQNASSNGAIVKEAELNNDIIQGDFPDMAEEETRKVLVGLTWIVEQMSYVYHCQPLHVLRAEADLYINMPAIFKWLKSQPRSNLYVGHVVHGNFPNRDVESPYYVSKKDYPHYNLPDYADSPVYLISYDNVKRFIGEISSVTPIAMDGVYIGLLAEHVGAKPTNNEHFILMKRPSNVCLYHHMFFIFRVNEPELIHIYNVVERHHNKRECSRTDF